MGKYILIDGPDGCGKTTLIERLKKDYPDIVYVKEPGDERFEINKAIRDFFLHGESLTDSERIHLMIADRLRLQRFVNQALADNKTVISDRSFVSTIAYQCNTDKCIGVDTIIDAHALYFKHFNPDHIVILDIEPETRIARMQHRNESLDNIEKKDALFFEHVIARYKQIKNALYVNGYETLSSKVCHLNANKDACSVYNAFVGKFL